MRRALVMFLTLLLLAVPASAATVYGSLPDDGIYIEQDDRHTCTLVSAAMMLRNHAFIYEGNYSDVTLEKVRSVCWSSYGLAQSFEYEDIKVRHNTDIASMPDKKAYLIEQLQLHPEGIVIYNARQPHAVFLFAYRADADVFFCADTTGENSMRMITLDETLLNGEGQQGKIDGITKIWQIVD